MKKCSLTLKILITSLLLFSCRENPLGSNTGSDVGTNFLPGLTLAPSAPGSVAWSATASSSLTTSPSLSWSASQGVLTSVSYYEVALGTYPGASDVVSWTNIGNVTTYTFNGLSLTNGSSYYAMIRAVDNDKRTSSLTNSSAFVVDTAAPQPPTSVVDGNITTSTTATPSISWTASTSASSARFGGYELALGTSAGATDILNWIDVGNVTSYTPSSGFTLTNGSVYYATVRAYKTTALRSTVANGDGFAVNTTSATFSCDFTSGSSTDCYAAPYSSTARPLVSFYRIGGANTSAGTYVDSSGVIKSAATNMTLQSESFDNASWSKSASAVTINATTSPSGTASAEKIYEDSSLAYHYVAQQFTVTAGTNYCFSVYLKGVENTLAQIQLGGTYFTNQYAAVNLSNGTITSTGNGTISNYGITNAGNNWYRAFVCAVASGSGNGATLILLRNSSGLTNYTGDGSSGIYTWGAQFEANSSPTNYTFSGATTNYSPRLDHDPSSCSAGTCSRKGLLIEEARTNKLLYSADLSNSSGFIVQAGLTITAASTTAPDGTTTGTLLNDSDAAQSSYLAQAVTVPNDSSSWTCSTYLKAGSAALTSLTMNVYGGTNFSRNVIVDWSTKTINSCNGTNCTLTNAGNGWYRASVTAANNSSGNTTIACYIYASNWHATGATTGTVYAWGGQLEQGAMPTSYIPTTSVELTRNRDYAIAYNLDSNWFDSTKGTLFSSFIVPALTANQFAVSIDDGGGNNFIGMYSNSSANLVFSVISGAAQQFGGFQSPVNLNQVNKSAMAFQNNDFAGSLNGANVATDASGSIPTVNQLAIGSYNSGNFLLNGWIQNIQYYNQRLNNNILTFQAR